MIATASPATVDPAPTDPAAPDEPDQRAAPGEQQVEPAGPRRHRRLLQRLRHPSTPSLLRLGMALACVPVALFVAAVQLGVARNDSTVRTVGRDATQGITAAQAIKQNLAELDEIVVRKLLDPEAIGPGGFPEEYDEKRGELHDNLVLAASDAPTSAAFRQPLVNIEYALAHYHTLVRDAFAAAARGDQMQAAVLYGRAHEEVMDGTLLPEADFLDKANTYVLNDTYDTQKARSGSTVRLIRVSWAVLVGFLLLVQLLLVRSFRRLLNPALVAATLVAVASGGFALVRLDTSSSELTTAREEAFDSLHVLARAQATVVSARQSEGQLLLDPSDIAAAAAQADFDTQAAKLLRGQGGDTVVLAEQAQSGALPEDAGGYLATVGGRDDGGSRQQAIRRAIVAFGEFVAADEALRDMVASGGAAAGMPLYRGEETYTELSRAIDTAQSVNQSTFDDHAEAAADAAAYVDLVTTVAAGGVLLLVVVGLYLRLREYGT